MNRLLTVMLVWALCAAPVYADAPLPAKLMAVEACPAVVSIRKQTNPDHARLTFGRVYPVLAANKQPPTHYRVRVPGADPVERWVAVACLDDPRSTSRKPPANGPVRQPAKPPPATGRGPEYVLALTWQPAFCQTNQRRPECRGQTRSRFDADHFSLHGLWPQPRSNVYCGVSRREQNRSWSRIPALDLSAGTRAELGQKMPGSRSNLQRHEWLKHGTCYGADAERYFSDALALLDQVNGSAVRALFADNLGGRLTAVEIRAEFDRAFGRGAGAKVSIGCKRGMIAELQLHLRGPITGQTPLGGLLLNAADTAVRCAAGRVDTAGP